ncbi:TatD DNase family protein [Lacibacter cauensis]|uniref:TatD DNase family protein n=1 Tax=Lacibacter cauensis TaxID=510947 RepID=A0A562SJ47_9BACT|nr:TatD family hydrolase [Lacibacter cauensis]TWI81281.1 TatD DNase family protein [Lacibacter cauensis]
MTIVDTHTHLYLEEFKVDIDEVLQKAAAEGVEQFYLPNVDSTSIDDLLNLADRYPGKCIPMMGLHPCYVKENAADELKLVQDWLQKRSFAAVGEIGLDYYWDKTFVPQQKDAFRQQISWALELNLPIVIHSRDSMQDCIDIVKEYQNGKLRGIFHCFGGSVEEAKQIIDLGFLMGIGGVVTYKKSGLAEVLPSIPLEYLVLETDAPYLSPVPFRGKRNEPSYLKYVVEKMAEIMQRPVEEIAAQTTMNAEKLFGSSK